MGKPAARVGDMHTCPMSDGPKPHVGGPIMPPGTPMILVGGAPAAKMGDLCTCVSPAPDSIVQGCFTVHISGVPGATLGHSTAHGGKIIVGNPTVHYGGSTIGSDNPIAADPALLEMVCSSPTLVNKVDQLLQQGWSFEYGPAGDGTSADREAKEIVIDSDQEGNILEITQSLSHEAGHATYTPDPDVSSDGLTRTEYIDANVNNNLKDEGEATLTNVEVRNEIIDKTGQDIGIAGTQTTDYERIAQDNEEGNINREEARQQIGDIFADNETASGTDDSYREYYSEPYEDFYDETINPDT